MRFYLNFPRKSTKRCFGSNQPHFFTRATKKMVKSVTTAADSEEKKKNDRERRAATTIKNRFVRNQRVEREVRSRALDALHAAEDNCANSRPPPGCAMFTCAHYARPKVRNGLFRAMARKDAAWVRDADPGKAPSRPSRAPFRGTIRLADGILTAIHTISPTSDGLERKTSATWPALFTAPIGFDVPGCYKCRYSANGCAKCAENNARSQAESTQLTTVASPSAALATSETARAQLKGLRPLDPLTYLDASAETHTHAPYAAPRFPPRQERACVQFV
jgi:hypothetical protein